MGLVIAGLLLVALGVLVAAGGRGRVRERRPFAYLRGASYTTMGAGAIIGAASPGLGFAVLVAGVAGLLAAAVSAHRAHA